MGLGLGMGKKRGRHVAMAATAEGGNPSRFIPDAASLQSSPVDVRRRRHQEQLSKQSTKVQQWRRAFYFDFLDKGTEKEDSPELWVFTKSRKEWDYGADKS